MEAVKCSEAKLRLFICINMNKTIQYIPYENLSPCRRRVRWKLTHFFCSVLVALFQSCCYPCSIALPSWKFTTSRLTENKIPTLTVIKTCATCIFMLTESEQNSSCVNSLITINSQQATYHQGQWADGNPCGQLEGRKKCHKKIPNNAYLPESITHFGRNPDSFHENAFPSLRPGFYTLRKRWLNFCIFKSFSAQDQVKQWRKGVLWRITVDEKENCLSWFIVTIYQ